MPLASLASARTLSFTRFSIFVCCLFVAAVATSAQTVPLPYRPVTAEYSYGLDRIIFVTAGPNQLHIFDPISQSDTAVNLSQAPLSLSMSPDGLHAAVGHNSLISYVNLQTASVEATYPSSFAATGLILATDYVYVLNPQGGGTVSIALSSGRIPTFNNYSGATAGRLHPSGTALYKSTMGALRISIFPLGPFRPCTLAAFKAMVRFAVGCGFHRMAGEFMMAARLYTRLLRRTPSIKAVATFLSTRMRTVCTGLRSPAPRRLSV